MGDHVQRDHPQINSTAELFVYTYWWQVHLIDVTSKSAPVKPTAGLVPVYGRDETLYQRISDGIVSLCIVELPTLRTFEQPNPDESMHRFLACSSRDASPMLVSVISSINVQTLNRPTNPNIGTASCKYRRGSCYQVTIMSLRLRSKFWFFALYKFIYLLIYWHLVLVSSWTSGSCSKGR